MGIKDKERIIKPDSEWKELFPLIVRKEFALKNQQTRVSGRFFAISHRVITPELAQDISDKLSHNSYMGFPHLGRHRPQSAYYLVEQGTLMIDLCLSTEIGKIHHELMREQNPEYQNIKLNDTPLLRSGHFGILQIPFLGEVPIAMIESLGVETEKALSPHAPEYPMVLTMAHNGIIPVNAIGHPIRINANEANNDGYYVPKGQIPIFNSDSNQSRNPL